VPHGIALPRSHSCADKADKKVHPRALGVRRRAIRDRKNLIQPRGHGGASGTDPTVYLTSAIEAARVFSTVASLPVFQMTVNLTFPFSNGCATFFPIGSIVLRALLRAASGDRAIIPLSSFHAL
jgi:hypothetical protein